MEAAYAERTESPDALPIANDCFHCCGRAGDGAFVGAVRVLRQGQRVVHVPWRNDGSRMFGDMSSPYYKWDIVGIDGKPFNAAEQYLGLSDAMHEGEHVRLTRRGPQGQIKEIARTAVMRPMQSSQYVSFISTDLFLRAFCFVPAFGVAAIRPRDPLA